MQSKGDNEALALLRQRAAELEDVKAALEKKSSDLMAQGTSILTNPRQIILSRHTITIC